MSTQNNRTPDDERALEVQIGRALRTLPTPAAPPRFADNVLAAVRQRAPKPWYQQPWRAWPPVWRGASAAVAGLAAVALVLLVPGVDVQISNPLSGWLTSLRAAASGGSASTLVTTVADIRAMFGALETAWRVIVGPVATYLIGAFALMWTACVACGLALRRVALGGA